MKKLIKVVSLTSVLFVLAASTFAAPKKTADDWASEIEGVTGSINWKFKDSLKNAKKFNGENFYSIANLGENKITIANPMVEKDNTNQFVFITKDDFIMKYLNWNTFDSLEKGDVFLTYEGSQKAVTDLWILTKKTSIKEAVKGDYKTGVTLTASAASSIVMQYRGWGTTVDNKTSGSSAGKNGYQGVTAFIDNGQSYYTVSKPIDGTFKVMIIDTKAKTLKEYVLQYLGNTSHETAVKAGQDKETAAKEAKIAKVKDPIIAHSGTSFNPKKTPEGLKGVYVYPKTGDWYIATLISHNVDKDMIIRNLLAYDCMSMLASYPRKLEWNKDGNLTYASGSDIAGEATIEYSGKNISVIHAKKSTEENAPSIDYKFSFDSNGKYTGVTWTSGSNNYETKIIYDDAGNYSKTECYKDGTAVEKEGVGSIPIENNLPFSAEKAFNEKRRTYDKNGLLKTFYIDAYKLWFYMEYEYDENGRPVKSVRHAIDENGEEVTVNSNGLPMHYECTLTYEGNSVKTY